MGLFSFPQKKNEAPFQLKSDLGLDLDCRTCFWFKTSIKSCEFHSHFTIIQKKQIRATKITTLPKKRRRLIIMLMENYTPHQEKEDIKGLGVNNPKTQVEVLIWEN